MVIKNVKLAVFLLFLLVPFAEIRAHDFTLVDNTTKAMIVYDQHGPALDSITAHLLAGDVERVTLYRPQVLTDITKAKGNVILIGSFGSRLIKSLPGNSAAFYKALAGKWECYALNVLERPFKNISRALVIAGSDNRGTAYGVFHVSEQIGVSPWYWWADVPATQKKVLTIHVNDYVSSTPSVKYRGIFLNDEDWGLQPWAAKTFEPETGDIGPKTYAKIFELLLRLKANLIWPAMHPSTKAFYHYPGNKKTAADYCIFIGSSHAEPMLRNNVGEWNEKTMGHFNYIINKQNVYGYWESRVKESSTNQVIYTLGMRGVHDSGIEGVKDVKEAVPLLERIIADQRDMLKTYVAKDVTSIPQVFTIYKEVLDIYENNLQLPDDVTLVWPDDNYGYIQRLNNEKEQQRAGGSGVYYHASYWGRPHDYLWLSSTHPSLIREEMMKAYENKSDRLWVLNVGDIKPLEYNLQLFMDMAYHAAPFRDSRYTQTHLLQWTAKTFGKDKAKKISDILWTYYQLAFERRPEFMGWSQTEPTTKTGFTEYNHFFYGDEAQRRIERYEWLEKGVRELKAQMDAPHAGAFYQMVYYPVTGASLMNKKFLYRDKYMLYSKQNRAGAADYAQAAKQAYDSIVAETNYYNNQLSGGKWKHMMSLKPRDLPVYQEPVLPEFPVHKTGTWNIAPEGFVTSDSSLLPAASQKMILPAFNRWSDQKYFVDVFLINDTVVSWTAGVSDNWIRLSQSGGVLRPDEGKKQVRLWVSVDWTRAPKKEGLQGQVTFKGAGKQIAVQVIANNAAAPVPPGYKGFVENNGYVSIYAAHYTRKIDKAGTQWKVLEGLGHPGQSLEAWPHLQVSASAQPDSIKATASCVEYDFYTFSAAPAEVCVYSLPTHPLNKNVSMRYAVSVDDGPVTVADFRTFGRSEEWKQNVLRNSANRKFRFPLNKGKHTLKIYRIDPGVIIDKITIDLGGLKKAYGTILETRINSF